MKQARSKLRNRNSDVIIDENCIFLRLVGKRKLIHHELLVDLMINGNIVHSCKMSWSDNKMCVCVCERERERERGEAAVNAIIRNKRRNREPAFKIMVMHTGSCYRRNVTFFRALIIDHKICIISWHRPHLDAAIKECAVHAQFTAEISSFIRVSSPSGDLIDSLFVSKPFFHLSFI